MRYKFGIGRLVTMHPVDAFSTEPGDCINCAFKCTGKMGKITTQHRDIFKEGYTVVWDDGSCFFSVEELRRVK
jgi:hypothetical protein